MDTNLVLVTVVIVLIVIVLLVLWSRTKESFYNSYGAYQNEGNFNALATRQYRGYSYAPYFPYYESSVYPNYDNDGPGYGSLTRSDCEMACRKNKSCYSYDYINNIDGGACMLKGGSS